MSATKNTATFDTILSSRVRIPQEVVYRSFVHETVILNLETGRYHGVNPTGSRMLDVLGQVGAVAEAAHILASDFDRPIAELKADLCEFCHLLVERGLLVIDRPAAE